LSGIAALKAARGGLIQGVARGSEQVPETIIPGVHVEAQGTTGRYTATTNKEGEFQIKVPFYKQATELFFLCYNFPAIYDCK